MISQLRTYYTTTTVTIPDVCVSIKIECYGGGAPGAGVNSSTGARAGASGAQYSTITIDTTSLIGATLFITVGATKSGTSGDGGNGNDTYVYIGYLEACRAKGGIGAIGNSPGLGSLTGGVGDIVHKGGDGAVGVDASYGGGGGGCAGPISDGGNASGPGKGNPGGYFSNYGGNGYTGVNGNGNPGGVAGGGGGGALRTDLGTALGGDGAAGLVVITYTLDKGSMFVIFD